MKKTRRNKKKALPPKPKSRRYTLYQRATSSRVLSVIVFVAFFAFGLGVFFEQQYLASLMPLSLAGLIAYSFVTEVKRLDIFEDKMIVVYLDSTATYKVEEIESVEWISVPVIGRSNIPNFYRMTPELLIQTKSGKKIQVPPPGGFDIQKSILDWRDKYEMPSGNQMAASK